SAGPSTWLRAVGTSLVARTTSRAICSARVGRSSAEAGMTVSRRWRPASSPEVLMCVEVVSVLGPLTDVTPPQSGGRPAATGTEPGHDDRVTDILARWSRVARNHP